MVVPEEVMAAFAPRAVDANKYSVGTVAVVGGSSLYPHAPVMAGLGARACGAGLVGLFVPEHSRACAGALLPEAVFPDGAEDGFLARADVVVAGPGMGRGDGAQSLFDRVLSVCGRVVVDADALWALAAAPRVFSPDGSGRPAAILTPHCGEAARLLGVESAAVSADREGAAAEIARRYGATVVLKGPGTLVASPGRGVEYRNGSGNPQMALGGMGDLLSGAIAAFWARPGGGSAALAASAGAWLHGAAADALVAAGRQPTVRALAAEMGSARVVLETGGGREARRDTGDATW